MPVGEGAKRRTGFDGSVMVRGFNRTARRAPAKAGSWELILTGFWQKTGQAARDERHRWPLWLPVLLGAGAGLYFTLPFEPSAIMGWAALAASFVAILLSIFWRWRIALALLAALALGFGVAKLREEVVAAPVLPQATVLHLTGR